RAAPEWRPALGPRPPEPAPPRAPARPADEGPQAAPLLPRSPAGRPCARPPEQCVADRSCLILPRRPRTIEPPLHCCVENDKIARRRPSLPSEHEHGVRTYLTTLRVVGEAVVHRPLRPLPPCLAQVRPPAE